MKQNNIHGLVLAGGLSRRMSEDKSDMVYHQLPQYEHVALLLKNFCDEVFISVRNPADKSATFPHITDQFPSEGPIAGILTALCRHPDIPWLIAPVDMPALDDRTLEFLLSSRSALHKITCFRNSEGSPEPLLSVWEPGVYYNLLQYYHEGGRSVRVFLENNGANLLTAPYPQAIVNINTPEERDDFLKKMQHKR